MWKSFENIGLQTSEKVSWEKKKHAQNIRSTVHRTGDLIISCVQREIRHNSFGYTKIYDSARNAYSYITTT